MNSNEKINIACVMAVAVIGMTMTVGIMYLRSKNVEVPENYSAIVLSITSGLIGFLSRGVNRNETENENSNRS